MESSIDFNYKALEMENIDKLVHNKEEKQLNLWKNCKGFFYLEKRTETLDSLIGFYTKITNILNI